MSKLNPPYQTKPKEDSRRKYRKYVITCPSTYKGCNDEEKVVEEERGPRFLRSMGHKVPKTKISQSHIQIRARL